MKNGLLFFLCAVLATAPLSAQPTTGISASSDWVYLKKQTLTVPIISWLSPRVKQVTETSPTTTVTVAVQSGDAAPQIQFFVNGKELTRQTRGFKRAGSGVQFSEVIPLVAGANEIYVKATNAVGSTTSDTRIINRQPETTAPGLASKSIPGQRRLALVVANGTYGKYPLTNPPNDGRAVKAQFETLGFEVTYKENLSLRDLTQTFDLFIEALGTHNVGLFYYAGHGLMVNGKPIRSQLNANPKTEPDVQFACYPLRQIVEKMAYANPSGANLVFWDACRNNPYRSWHRGMGRADISPG